MSEPCMCGDPFCGRCGNPEAAARSEKIGNAVQDLLDVATDAPSNGDETFHLCHVCGDCDSHKADCFVPLLQKWQES